MSRTVSRPVVQTGFQRHARFGAYVVGVEISDLDGTVLEELSQIDQLPGLDVFVERELPETCPPAQRMKQPQKLTVLIQGRLAHKKLTPPGPP